MEKSALMKQLINHLHSKKGQEKTLPASLWMRYKAVEQSTLSSPLRILAVADSGTARCLVFAPVHRQCGERKCRKGRQRPLGNR
jgi:hypothetical protein